MLDIKNLGKGIEIGGLGKKAAIGAAGGGVLGAFTAEDTGSGFFNGALTGSIVGAGIYSAPMILKNQRENMLAVAEDAAKKAYGLDLNNPAQKQIMDHVKQSIDFDRIGEMTEDYMRQKSQDSLKVNLMLKNFDDKEGLKKLYKLEADEFNRAAKDQNGYYIKDVFKNLDKEIGTKRSAEVQKLLQDYKTTTEATNQGKAATGVMAGSISAMHFLPDLWNAAKNDKNIRTNLALGMVTESTRLGYKSVNEHLLKPSVDFTKALMRGDTKSLTIDGGASAAFTAYGGYEAYQAFKKGSNGDYAGMGKDLSIIAGSKFAFLGGKTAIKNGYNLYKAGINPMDYVEGLKFGFKNNVRIQQGMASKDPSKILITDFSKGPFKLKTAIDEGYMDSQLLAYQNSPELKQLHSIAKTHGNPKLLDTMNNIMGI